MTEWQPIDTWPLTGTYALKGGRWQNGQLQYIDDMNGVPLPKVCIARREAMTVFGNTFTTLYVEPPHEKLNYANPTHWAHIDEATP
jgi:hypothetical protein